MFLDKNIKQDICSSDGWVYIFRFELDDIGVVYKIGITRRCDKERMPMQRFLEVLNGMYYCYGYSPKGKIKKYRKVVDMEAVEEQLHKEFEEWKYEPPKRFGGSTEFFIGVDEEVLFSRYEELVCS